MKNQADQNKISTRGKSRSGLAFFWAATLIMLPSINSRIDLHVRKDLRHQSSDHNRAIAAEKAPVFLETVQNSSTPAVYKIYGQPFELTDNLLVNSNEQDKHFGAYHATNLEIQQKAEG